MTKTHLVIPDSHVRSTQDLKHFKALGNLIVERRPDVIVDLGDRADLGKLAMLKSSSFSEKRYDAFFKYFEEEAEAIKQSIVDQFEPLFELQKAQRLSKRKVYQPKTVYLLGNHCKRAASVLGTNPKRFFSLYGATVDMTDKDPVALVSKTVNRMMGFSWYDEVFDYTVPAVIDGIFYSHTWLRNGVKLRSPKEITAHLMAASVSGDSHTYEYERRFAPVTGRPIHCLQAGVFFDPNDTPLYYDTQNRFSPSGVTLLHEVDGTGNFDIEFVSYERLLRLHYSPVLE